MIPGFVALGALAVLFQLLVVAAFYGYLRTRHPVADSTRRRRAARGVFVGAALAALGQLAALGAVGSLRVAAVLSFRQAMTVTNAGVGVALVGYVGVFAGIVVHLRAG